MNSCDYLSNVEVSLLKDKIDNYNNLISSLIHQIKQIEKDIHQIKDELENKCQHKKIINHNSYSERTEYVCEYCGTIF